MGEHFLDHNAVDWLGGQSSGADGSLSEDWEMMPGMGLMTIGFGAFWGNLVGFDSCLRSIFFTHHSSQVGNRSWPRIFA